MNKTLLAITATLALSVLSAPSFGEADPEKIIKYRQSAMGALKEHNAAIKLIVKGDVPFADQLGMHIQSMDAILSKVGSLFPEGSDFGETDAKEAIWEQPEKFQQAVKNSQQAMASLKAAAATGNLAKTADAYSSFGKEACGGCHRPFRSKD